MAINTIAQSNDSLSAKILPLPGTDSSAKLSVHQIKVSGNKKTRVFIILREIQFKPGDSIIISNLTKEIELARQQVYNTTLFSEVNITPVFITATEMDVIVTVKERWYLYPLPQFQPVDRNLNEWLVKYKGDLTRVNYGVKFVDFNLTGRRDPLRIYLMNGYTRNISFSYTQPFSSKALTEGFVFGAGYAQSREIAYKTSYDNKLQFYKNGNFVRDNFFVNAGYSFRKAILGRHLFNIMYTKTTVNDSVAMPVYNPDYFKNGATSRSFLDLTYTYRYINVDNIIYPLKGITWFTTLSKRGLGFTGSTNMFFAEGGYNKYHDFTKNWYGSIQFSGKIKLPFDQPYFNQRAIGYGEANLRGLEYYVVDAATFGIFKSTVKKKLVSFTIPFPFKSTFFPNIPFTIYAKTFTDIGYAYNIKKYDSFLNNKFLYTGGFGIDIISLYDINLKIEYSFNQLGQKGLFLQTQGGF
jgi:outer membrane protein assembly factor BamA